MTSLCCRSVSSRVISQLRVDQLLTSKRKEPSHRCRSVGPVAPAILVSTITKDAGAMARQDPPATYAITIHPVRI